MPEDLKDQIVKAHELYYSHITGPIGGRDRFEWVARVFFKNIAGKKILEIGCGEGSLLELISKNNEVYGVDISSSGVEKTKKKGIPCHLADASNERLPYEDNFFDIVISLETIEHVENPHRMVWEIKRILKDQGTFLVSIPGSKVVHPFIYPGLFSRKNFSEFLEQNYFEIEKVTGWGQSPMLSHWEKKTREKGSGFGHILADIVYYIGRKRNLLMRKRFGTPLSRAYCVNFLCTNIKTRISRVEEVAARTTPL